MNNLTDMYSRLPDSELHDVVADELARLRAENEALAPLHAVVRDLLSMANGHYPECVNGRRGNPPDDSEHSSCSAVCRRLRAALHPTDAEGQSHE